MSGTADSAPAPAVPASTSARAERLPPAIPPALPVSPGPLGPPLALERPSVVGLVQVHDLLVQLRVELDRGAVDGVHVADQPDAGGQPDPVAGEQLLHREPLQLRLPTRLLRRAEPRPRRGAARAAGRARGRARGPPAR